MKDKNPDFEINIEMLSPTHVGNGNIISSLGEYFLTSDRVIFPEHEKMHTAISEIGKMDEYIEFILNHEGKLNVYDQLKKWDIPVEIKRTLRLNQNKQITDQNNNLYEHIKNGDDKGRAYIPGSSLKGMIRTALIYQYIENNNRLKREFNDEIRSILSDSNPKKEYLKYWTQFESQIFSEQLARAIRCEDSGEAMDEDLIVEQVHRTGSIGTDTDTLDWLVESVGEGCILDTRIVLNPFHLKKIKEGIQIQTLSDIISALNSYSKVNLVFEKNEIRNSNLEAAVKNQVLEQINDLLFMIEESNDEYAVARIGKGKTAIFQTIWMNIEAPLREKIIQLFKKEGQEIYPETRVLTVNGKQMMGWIKLDKNKPPKNIFDNKVESLNQGDVLKATVLQKKKVEVSVNGKTYIVDMINKFIEFEEYELIEVVVHQLKKDGTLSQVKPKS